MKNPFFLLPLLILSLWSGTGTGGEIKRETSQLLIGIAPDWNSSYVNLTYLERGAFGNWRKKGSWQGRLGRNGLAWGLGLHDPPAGARFKREGDGRTPAGIFDISHGAYGYAPSIRKKNELPYRQITSRCLWFEDTSSPRYNSFLLLDREPVTEAEKKAQMRQGDYAHSLKLFIAHNAPPQARPGFGSAIFFHIWRGGGSKPTAGCTTMAEENLKTLIANIDPGKNPRYVILPKAEYEELRDLWNLPRI